MLHSQIGLSIALAFGQAGAQQAPPTAPKTDPPSSAQQASEDQPVEWRFSKEHDALRGISFDQFVLDGKYLTPPSLPTRRAPSLVVRCFSGKFGSGNLMVGAVVKPVRGAHSFKGSSQGYVEMRMDDKKKLDDDWWEISNDGQALFFDKIQLIKLMTGKLLGHPGDTKTLTHRVIIGVGEAFGNELTDVRRMLYRVVMQFDMPRDAAPLVEMCGLEWSKKKRK